MAQRVNVVLVDDIDGGSATETVQFGLDGTDYVIDLSAKNAAQFRKVVGSYVDKGRRVSGRRTGPRRSRGRAGGASDAARIREWAREKGYQVSERGRVSAQVREAYAAAH